MDNITDQKKKEKEEEEEQVAGYDIL